MSKWQLTVEQDRVDQHSNMLWMSDTYDPRDHFLCQTYLDIKALPDISGGENFDLASRLSHCRAR